MAWFYYFVLLLVCVVGLATAMLTLPGLWLMTAATGIYALLTHGRIVGAKVLIALFVLALLSEIVEMSVGGAATRRAGGGRLAAVGGVVGALLGGLVFPFLLPFWGVSAVIGLCLGSFLGAGGAEAVRGKQIAHSLRVGFGAAKGRIVGLMAKLVFGIAMFLLILVAAFP